MIRLLKFLFIGDWHLHKWKIIETRRAYEEKEDGSYAKMATGTRYYCQCEQCGIIKIFD